jgi:trigger factor
VRPSVSIGGYDGLQVTLPGLDVKDEEVQRQIDRLRENDAELEVVDRPAIDGDLVTIDLHGNDASGAEVVGVDDYLYEVGTGTVVPELDAELHGAKAGAIVAFDAASPQNPDEQIAFRVLVKEVKVKKLPAETDEWAAESSEFATMAELRADIEERIRRVKLVQTQMALRQKAIEALSGLVTDDDVPEVLVDAEVNERLHDLQHRLEAQKLGLAEYFQATGTSPDELLASVRVDAHAAVKADLALRALVEAEELPLSDDELDAEVSTMAERMDTSPADLRRRLDTAGRTGAVRSELRKGKALEWLLDHVDLVDEEGNPVSRDALKVDASGDGEVEQDEETSEDAEDG